MLARIRRAVAAEGFRTRLADPDSLLHFSVLGLLAGVLAGLSIVVYRFIVESSLGAMLPGGDPENFEALDPSLRLLETYPASAGRRAWLLHRPADDRRPN